MKAAKFLLGSLMLALSLNAGADDATSPTSIKSADSGNIDSLNILSVSPCKTTGDGTYVEMITTMASVLPPELADAFLARYCEECYKRKFQLTQKH